MIENNSELVSVILPVRNGERFLAAALQSILAQDYGPIEILVIDGNSTDRTAEIVRSFPQVNFHTQPGRGVPDAYNFGVAQAKGEWVAFLESDDTWTPDKLRVQMDYMRARPELLFTMTHAKLFVEPGCALPAGYRTEWTQQSQIGSVLSSFVARKKVFELVGPFDSRYSRAGDVDWFARAKDLKVPTAFLDETLLLKRIHDSNLTSDAAINNAELLGVIRKSLQRQRTA